MKWLKRFIQWLRVGSAPEEKVPVQPIPEVKTVEEKAKEEVVVTSKQVSDNIRDVATPETILADLRSMSTYTRIDGPTSDDILNELRKISEQITRSKF